ncbi:ferredoxin [Yinghuangia sp. ASG 101]|uniref:ferredoxin n=1 Tax=Yinghuangia sp. ASG 101 TaxID=2896848 RepID=UPI001E4E2027|nr:ferredoxin [Yinghuangia sp. ASG 101]UGQ11010.1 ferredoxin [Yinghuangia sp. ASG 101]
MKVRVDPVLCQGHTGCAMTAPGIFTLRDEDGHAEVKDEHVPAAHEAAVREAVLSCPEQAITAD